MCDQKPPWGSDDTSEGEPQRMTTDHLRRVANRWPDLRDPVLIVKAWDEPPTPDATSATNSPRRLSKLQDPFEFPTSSMFGYVARKSLIGLRYAGSGPRWPTRSAVGITSL